MVGLSTASIRRSRTAASPPTTSKLIGASTPRKVWEYSWNRCLAGSTVPSRLIGARSRAPPSVRYRTSTTFGITGMLKSALAITSRSSPRATLATPFWNPSTTSRVVRGQSSSRRSRLRRAQVENTSGTRRPNVAMVATSKIAAAALKHSGTGLRTLRKRTPPIGSAACRQVWASISRWCCPKSLPRPANSTAVSRLSSNWGKRRSSSMAMFRSLSRTKARRRIIQNSTQANTKPMIPNSTRRTAKGGSRSQSIPRLIQNATAIHATAELSPCCHTYQRIRHRMKRSFRRTAGASSGCFVLPCMGLRVHANFDNRRTSHSEHNKLQRMIISHHDTVRSNSHRSQDSSTSQVNQPCLESQG